MTNAIKVIYPDGTEEELNRKLSLQEMQKMKIVGGLIQIVPANIPHRSLVVNEEGILKQLPPNKAAYALLHPDFDWGKQPHYEDFCVLGTVILIKSR